MRAAVRHHTLFRGVKVIACYPRMMSAWLSNLLTIPDWSLYAHDALHDPGKLARLAESLVPIRGIVDTGAGMPSLSGGGLEGIDVESLTVIDADQEVVREKVERFLGKDIEVGVGMENLKSRADRVLRFSDWDEWIGDFYKEHTGLDMDWDRYEFLLNLNVQSQLARRKECLK